MKKTMIIVICVMSLMILVTGCNIEDSSDIVSDSAVDTTEVQSVNPGDKEGLASIIDGYVTQGVLTQEEGDALIQYLEDNKPQQGEPSGDMPDPLSGAVSAGIITQEQADMMESSLMPGGQDVEQGMSGAGAEMLSVEEANAIEDQLLADVGYTSAVGGYPIVDTDQTEFYSNEAIISEPAEGEAFYGQDGTYEGSQPSYTDNGDGTVTDNVTGLMWQQDPGDKIDWDDAVDKLETFELAGYDDWRIPTIKELYSLVHFSGVTGTSSDTSIPYIDTDYFEFEYGDAAGEPRFIDSQMLSSTIYDSTTLGGNTTVFGYNFADGRIKGYEITKEFYCYFVRGNTNYGQNQFVENGDDTITDEATGLMWMTFDSGYYEAGDAEDGTMDWESALEWAENFEFAGYDNWKLPNVKELQSLLDYTKSPDTTGSPAIDDMFYCTPITNFFGEDDYGFYWSSTSHIDAEAEGTNPYAGASYVVFGKGMGVMNSEVVDAHGSGSQRSDPKTGDREDYPTANVDAPQGDEQRVFNMIRLVRIAD